MTIEVLDGGAAHHRPGPPGAPRVLARRCPAERADGRPVAPPRQPHRRQRGRRAGARDDDSGPDVALRRRAAHDRRRRGRDAHDASTAGRPAVDGRSPCPPARVVERRRHRRSRAARHAGGSAGHRRRAVPRQPRHVHTRWLRWSRRAGARAPATSCASATRRAPIRVGALPPGLAPVLGHDWELGVLVGPHTAPDFLTDEGLDDLLRAEWTVHFNSARTGIRLVGPRPQWARSDGGDAGLHPSNIHDTGYAVGSVDLTGDMPVILGPDGPSLGGFVCPAVVAAAERWKLGPAAPGDRVRLVPWSAAMPRPRDERRQDDGSHAARRRSNRSPVPRGTAAAARRGSTDDADRRPPRPTDGTIPASPIAAPVTASSSSSTARWRSTSTSRCAYMRSNSGCASTSTASSTPRRAFARCSCRSTAERPTVDGVQRRCSGAEDDLGDGRRRWRSPRGSCTFRCRGTTRRRGPPSIATCTVCAPTRPGARGTSSSSAASTVCRRSTMSIAPSSPRRYLVLGLGDVYLGAPVATPLDPRHRLVTTKYNPARTWTPENAVGIGGAYLCIYGMEGPGGYQFVGRTVQVWNRDRRGPHFDQPWLLRNFDQIQFHPVDCRRTAWSSARHGRGESSRSDASRRSFVSPNTAASCASTRRDRGVPHASTADAFDEERAAWAATR